MLTRRRFAGYSALSSLYLATPPLLRSGLCQTSNEATQSPLRLAVLGSTYRRGSALQTIADRFLIGYPHEGEWHIPNIKVVSLYVDQRSRRAEARPSDFARIMAGTARVSGAARQQAGVQPGEHASANPHVDPAVQSAAEQLDPMSDLSEARAEQFELRLCRNIPEALRCGGERLAVDAVLTIVEPDDYPHNDKGQILLPAYDFFQQCAHVFAAEGHAVPYFNHKQLSFSFIEAQNMVATAERLKFPFLAGSSMPVTWRLPDTDIPLDARVQEAVMVGPGSFDGMDFDALEAMQSMLERRKGGETGVQAIQLLEGDDVWVAAAAGRWSRDLLSSALSRSGHAARPYTARRPHSGSLRTRCSSATR